MDSKLRNYKEAIGTKDNTEWSKAMEEDMTSLKKNQTWVLVDKLEKQKLMGSKWISERKAGISRVEKTRYKARVVAKGFTQKEWIDFNEVFSPIVKYTSIRILLSLVAYENLELEQIDVKTAFLHGELEETIYTQQPKGYLEPGKEHKVYLLKSLFMVSNNLLVNGIKGSMSLCLRWSSQGVTMITMCTLRSLLKV